MLQGEKCVNVLIVLARLTTPFESVDSVEEFYQ